MKKFFILVVSLFTYANSFAQSYDQMVAQYKQSYEARADISKMTRKELNSKASKMARKEAKSKAKEGYKNAPGTLPLEAQLDKSYNLQYDVLPGDILKPRYIFATQMSVGENYDAAKIQAVELAKQTLAGQIATEITGLIENTVSNKQLSHGEAASIVETISASKNLISQKIGRTMVVVEMYRDLANGNKEVAVTVFYDYTTIEKDAKEILREELKKKGDNLHEQLDKALGI